MGIGKNEYEEVLEMDAAAKKGKLYTYEEFRKFVNNAPEGQQFEWIDGAICMSPSPVPDHQAISMFLSGEIYYYLKGKPCKVFHAPLDLELIDEETKKPLHVYQPDIMVICDKSKIGKNAIVGTPDFVIEIVSPSNSKRDYLEKFNNYMKFGVKEYWIVDPRTRLINVYINSETDIYLKQYTFKDKVKVGIFEDLYIDFSELALSLS